MLLRSAQDQLLLTGELAGITLAMFESYLGWLLARFLLLPSAVDRAPLRLPTIPQFAKNERSSPTGSKWQT